MVFTPLPKLPWLRTLEGSQFRDSRSAHLRRHDLQPNKKWVKRMIDGVQMNTRDWEHDAHTTRCTCHNNSSRKPGTQSAAKMATYKPSSWQACSVWVGNSSTPCTSNSRHCVLPHVFHYTATPGLHRDMQSFRQSTLVRLRAKDSAPSYTQFDTT